MTRKAMAGIGVAVVVVLAALGFLMGGPLVSVGVLVVGVLGVVVVLQRTADGASSAPAPVEKTKPTRGGSAIDRIADLGATASAAPMLPTWSPPAGAPEVEPEPAPTTKWDDEWSADDDWGSDSWPSGSGSVDQEANPLDEISSLDDVDVIAEVERYEVPTVVEEPAVEEVALDEAGADLAELHPLDAYPINEEVSSADDIMAASHATELTVTESAGENAELAKLLAKVQARLAAYE